MYLTSDVKKGIFGKHGGKEVNTGAAESQIALFSFRINHLTEHLKANKHDYNTQRALIAVAFFFIHPAETPPQFPCYALSVKNPKNYHARWQGNPYRNR